MYGDDLFPNFLSFEFLYCANNTDYIRFFVAYFLNDFYWLVTGKGNNSRNTLIHVQMKSIKVIHICINSEF